LSVLAAALAISVVTDLRSRLIYNVVTGPALLVELVLVGLATGLPGLEQAGIGLLICAGPLALGLLFKSNWMGMGDIKLMAVVGAAAGPTGGWLFALNVLFCISIAGGVLAAVPWLIATIRARPRPRYVPYGVAIAAGALAAWLLG